MSTAPTLGFIGFGEAAPAIAAGLHAAGLGNLLAYDIAYPEARRDTFEDKARLSETMLLDSPRELADRCQFIFSLVTCSEAVVAAESLVPHLQPHHVLVDMNSASPAVKREVDTLVRGAGARFVEAAVMSMVPPNRQRVPMLLCGAAAPEISDRFTPYGMVLEVIDGDVGSAAAAKMFRSIVVKGLQALFVECLLAANHYGVEKKVLDSITESFPGLDWDGLAHYLTGRSAVHGTRQGHEMEEVSRTLEELGEEPVMSKAAAQRLLALGELDLKQVFDGQPPDRYQEVLRAMGR